MVLTNPEFKVVRLCEKARNATQATDHYVRENTWSTIAVAAAVGAVLGCLLVGGREKEEEG